MPTSNYPNGFSAGVSIRGIPILNTYSGNVFWVDSVEGSDGNNGTHYQPFATIDYAIGKCTANNGDAIMVKAGHVETISAASGIDFDVVGVSCVGLGSGSDRPTITHSVVASTMVVDAANVTISNLLFTPSAASTIIVDVNAVDCTIENCEFRMGTAVTAIDVNGGGANACDRTRIMNNVFDASSDGPDTAIGLDEVADSVIIDGNYAYGLFDDACVHNPTGKVLTWLRITNNLLVNTTSASHSIELVSACTGIIADNRCGSPLADNSPTDVDGGSTHMTENYSHDAGANNQGLLNPVADS